MQAPTLFTIAQDLEHMQVLASVDESDIGRVLQGQTVSFLVDAYPGQTFAGTVSQVRLQPTVEQNVVSYTTVIDVPNPGLKLKPGMTANVTIEIARADDVLRVPNGALRLRPTDTTGSIGDTAGERAGHRVFVWSDGAMHRQPVETGLSDGTMTAVTSGLTEGADVVTSLAGPTQTAQAATSSPLLPFGNRRGGAGGAGGAGSARGAGGTR
jgi:HlyD family secretion protein